MSSQVYCDKCSQMFKTEYSLNRHKLHSCPFNADRTPRADSILRRTSQTKLYRRKTKQSPTNKTNMNTNTNTPEKPSENQNHTNAESSLFDSIVDRPMMTPDMIHTLQPDEVLINKIINGIKDRVMDKINQLEPKLDKLDKFMNNVNAIKAPTNVFNIEKIQIYMTDSIDFIDVLTKRMGSRKQAVDYIRSKIHKKVEGDVDVFCEIYLHGAPDTWPISCPDKKNHIFRIAQPNSEVINDPGGVQIYKMFKNVYSNTLLRLNNSMIYDTINKIPGTPEYEESRDQLLDSFEMGLIQDKAHELCKAPCDPFIKKLSTKFKSLEKSYELDN